MSDVRATHDAGRDWISWPVVVAIAAFALVTLGVHTWQTVRPDGGYPSMVASIYIALARDTIAGVFYRPLAGVDGYGGTRYFPLYFLLIGALLRCGLSVVAAAWTAGTLSLGLFAAGVYAVVRSCDGRRQLAVLCAAGSITTYFVHQAFFGLTADLLAAALNLFGVAIAIRAWSMRALTWRVAVTASTLFVLAFLTKVTSAAVPAAVVLGFLLTGRWRHALRLGITAAAMGAAMLGAVIFASHGRALESWRICMFAGENGGGTIRALLSGAFLYKVSYSHFLKALLVLDVAAIAAFIVGARRRDTVRSTTSSLGMLVGALVVVVTAGTAFELSSVGTAHWNQLVEWIGISLVSIAAVAGLGPSWSRAVSLLMALLVMWSTWQSVERVMEASRAPSGPHTVDASRDIASLFANAPGPILTESPLLPLLAGQRPYVLDPFALRVVSEARPDVRSRLIAELDQRRFSYVILEIDPNTAAGRAWYEHMDFGGPILSRIDANYRFEKQLGDVYLYTPRAVGQ